MRAWKVAIGVVLVAACSRSSSTAPPSAPEAAAPARSVEPDGGSGEGARTLTAAECEAQGGKVVGDIGDGAIHRPDYRCPESGEPPVGTIESEPGGAVAIEGAVCCK